MAVDHLLGAVDSGEDGSSGDTIHNYLLADATVMAVDHLFGDVDAGDDALVTIWGSSTDDKGVRTIFG